ncbi:hypothetical protein ACI0FS_14795 [Ochrobactrum quorumnocens]|uniref:hypothetical protein n=1 Tax=Ochrobactrum quorumnocens TaxID=271865 RepID=UPI000A618A87
MNKTTFFAYARRAPFGGRLSQARVSGTEAILAEAAKRKPISVKPDTAVYLASNDTKAGQGIASHNSFGKSAGCWR